MTTKHLESLADAKLAYIAGFLDGDGSIYPQIVKRPDSILKFQIRFTISFTQKDRRRFFLVKLKKTLGLGTFRKRKDNQCSLDIVGIDGCRALLTVFLPFIELKRRQAKFTLEIIERLPAAKNSPHDFLQLCYLADKVSSFNDSKNRAITGEIVKKEFMSLGLLD